MPTTQTDRSDVYRFVTRATPGNPDHHLWCNHGVWWCHFTLKAGHQRRLRKRVSLKTHDRDVARAKRDRLFAAIQATSRIAA